MTLLLALVTIPVSDPTVIALIGTIMGGVGLKVVEHWLSKNRVKTDYATDIRNELRLTITAQNAEIKDLEKQVDRWKGDYYDLRDKHMQLEVQLLMLKQQSQDL